MSIAVDRIQNYYQYQDAESKFYSVSDNERKSWCIQVEQNDDVSQINLRNQ